MNAETPPTVTTAQRDAFYAAAVVGLRALDARERSPRRFGPEADARWADFRGALTDADRVDLLLHDAAVTWGPAFSPAEVFGLFGLAPDEPFGPDWQALPRGAARRHLEAGSPPSTHDLATALGIHAPSPSLPAISTSTRLAVAGGGALLAVAEAFRANPSWSWSDQVLAVASSPANRQLAGLLAIFAGGRGRTRLVRPGEDLRAVLQRTFDCLLLALDQAEGRLDDLDQAVAEVAETEPAVQEDVALLRCLHGIDTVAAISVVTELYAFERFHDPGHLMGFLGQTPSEHSSRGSRRQGGITKTGNAHVRRILVECAWAFRNKPRVGAALRKRRAGQPAWAIAIADKARRRLYKRYWHLVSSGKHSNKAVSAIARELTGFIWAILTEARTRREARAA